MRSIRQPNRERKFVLYSCHMKRFLIGLVAALPFLAPSVAFAKPTISQVTPVTATTGVATTFQATVSSASPIQSCNLWIDLADTGPMTLNGNVASRSYTFTSGGARIAFVFCRDTGGEAASGPNTSIWVEGPIQQAPPLENQPAPPPTETPTTTTPTSPTAPGARIKLICPEVAPADHVCKAVYYLGRDGKRHAFPNERTYFSWYSNFDGVTEVEASVMAGFTLGSNVTYRPGSRLVKFLTDNKVYAISRDGLLRWVTTEALARTYYGDDWTTKVDDIPDAFFVNYTFGSPISVITDYDPARELSTNQTID